MGTHHHPNTSQPRRGCRPRRHVYPRNCMTGDVIRVLYGRLSVVYRIRPIGWRGHAKHVMPRRKSRHLARGKRSATPGIHHPPPSCVRRGRELHHPPCNFGGIHGGGVCNRSAVIIDNGQGGRLLGVCDTPLQLCPRLGSALAATNASMRTIIG